MELPKSLVSEFAKLLTQNQNATETETTVYGQVTSKDSDGNYYATLDGANNKTPVEHTVGIDINDRVMIQIKNHRATVIGNITNPSADSKNVETISNSVSNISESVDGLSEDVATLRNLDDYLKVEEWTDPDDPDNPVMSLVIGEKSSNTELRITNKKIIFSQDGEAKTTIQSGETSIKNEIIEDKLNIGSFVWQKHDGNLALVYAGGSGNGNS